MNIGLRFSRYLRPLARLAGERGIALYAVGGCVRDGLLRTVCRDIDLVVEADALPLARAAVKRWGGSFTVFDRFGTVRLILKGEFRIDIARARTETYPRPAALPIVNPATISEDLKRRDFAINAMARKVTASGMGPLIDPFGGVQDLKARRLRILHPMSFQDDPTRIFRAARYAGRLAFSLDTGTVQRLRAAVRKGLPSKLSRERVRQELVRILEEKDPGSAMRRLRSWKLFPVFHPRFRWAKKAEGARDALVRLGICAAEMGGEDGVEFIKSLTLPRANSAALQKALRIREERRSPREESPRLTLRVLRSCLPEKPSSAFQSLFVSGADLKRLGLAPGKDYALWLDRAARHQWRGVHRRRSEALAWLKSSLSGS